MLLAESAVQPASGMLVEGYSSITSLREAGDAVVSGTIGEQIGTYEDVDPDHPEARGTTMRLFAVNVESSDGPLPSEIVLTYPDWENFPGQPAIREGMQVALVLERLEPAAKRLNGVERQVVYTPVSVAEGVFEIRGDEVAPLGGSRTADIARERSAGAFLDELGIRGD